MSASSLLRSKVLQGSPGGIVVPENQHYAIGPAARVSERADKRCRGLLPGLGRRSPPVMQQISCSGGSHTHRIPLRAGARKASKAQCPLPEVAQSSISRALTTLTSFRYAVTTVDSLVGSPVLVIIAGTIANFSTSSAVLCDYTAVNHFPKSPSRAASCYSASRHLHH